MKQEELHKNLQSLVTSSESSNNFVLKQAALKT